MALSESRARAVRRRQERLNNSVPDLSLAEPDAQRAAEQERQRTAMEVAAEIAAQQAAAEARVQELRKVLAKQMVQQRREVEARIRQRQAERERMAGKSGSESRTAMSNALVTPEPLPRPAPLEWRPTRGPQTVGEARGAVERLAQERRARQARVLVARRADLARRLRETTTRVVSGVALMQGWVIHFPPVDPAEGEDLTETIRPMLRELYAGE
jgi:hypothetical protein